MTSTSETIQGFFYRHKDLIPKPFKIFYNKLYGYLKKTNMFRKYFPINVMIEVSTYCNLKCRGCYRNLRDFSAINKNMSLDDFKMYFGQLPRVGTFILQGLGETTLNPRIQEMVEYAKKSGKVKGISFTTNALAHNHNIFEELFSKGLNQLIISVDSLDSQEVMELRTKTDVKLLTRNITYLLKKFPDKIVFGIVISTINQYTYDKTIKKLINLGAKRIMCQPFEDQGNPSLCLTFKEKLELLNRIKQIEKKNADIKVLYHFERDNSSKVQITLSDRFKRIDYHPCDTFGMAVITVEGYMIPCCALMDGDIYNYGNLKEIPFKKLFYSKKHKELQSQINRGNYPSFCKICSSNHIYMMAIEKK